ncbi:MAG TPA: PD-(D/E)XK nuclease family protein [Leptolyngbyaceae cyanobacterium]
MLINLTQGHLGLLEACPRKFQQVYLEGLNSPPSPDLQYSQLWGNRFHLLMQQRELGMPLPVASDDEGLQECMQALLETAPDLFKPDLASFRQSEHRRSHVFNGYILTVIYDLLILKPNSGLIIDWKTYLQPKHRANLEQDWQTRLYLYVLVETTDFQPDQVSMSYWFVRNRDPQTQALAPQQVAIRYSLAKHEQTRQALTKLTQALSKYQSAGEFPLIAPGARECDRCSFVAPCGRLPETSLDFNLANLPALEEIEEVPL